MAHQPNRKRACVMIVDQDFSFGIKLADWLAARGYQAVLIRSIDTAIEECKAVNPQAVFIKLSDSQSTEASNLPDLLRTIEAACARAPVLIIPSSSCRTDTQATSSKSNAEDRVLPKTTWWKFP
jgi:ActR/RegA family two-component response regulator